MSLSGSPARVPRARTVAGGAALWLETHPGGTPAALSDELLSSATSGRIGGLSG